MPWKYNSGQELFMLASLLTEQRNPTSISIDTKSTAEILGIINDEDFSVPGAVRKAIPSIIKVVDRTVEAVRGGGRLFYIGAGTSGRLGVLDASECPPTFSVPADLVQGIIAGGERALAHSTEASEDDPASGARDLVAHGFSERDVLIGIAASGRTPYVLGAVQRARDLGAATAAISCTPQSQLSQAVHIPIEVLVGPEIVTGSTRMKAGTATKLVLNMISTAVMIRLGHVYGNLMVNVQPRNEKLRDRAARIISAAAGVSSERAGELLAAAGTVKTAIVMAARGVDRSEAEQLLADAGGIIGRVVTERP
jgi:N-acetylmuramic acid 6-phosphate etherase